MKILLIVAMLFGALFTHAQDVKKIMQQSYEKCQSIEQGYYEVESNFKFYDHNYYTNRYYSTYFKQKNNDLNFAFYFQNKKGYKDTLQSLEVYNGDTLLRAFIYDSTASLMSKSSDIRKYKHNLTFFKPFLNYKSYPLNLYKKEKEYNYSYLGTEENHNSTCHHIQVLRKNNKKINEDLASIKIEFNFWIDTNNHLPIQYTEEYVILVGKDTQTQFETVTLHKLDTSLVLHDSLFTIKSIPSYFKIKNFEPYIRPELLKKDSIFPDFKYVNLKGDSVQLSTLKGKVVLIDFFYKSCYPCVLALPHIEALHKKYKDQGLVVLGIDPFDKKKVLEPFMKTQNITYEVLLGKRKEIREKYHVSGYPCVYILNKKGEILLAKTGYGKGMEKKYNKVIKKALKRD